MKPADNRTTPAGGMERRTFAGLLTALLALIPGRRLIFSGRTRPVEFKEADYYEPAHEEGKEK